MAIHKVLVVDDSKTELMFLTDLLQKNGFSVKTAENADDALRRLAEEKPDLILMDVVMPGQNGFQLTRAITRDPQYADVPIIMCTSKNQETDRVWGMRQGARDYIVKPVECRRADGQDQAPWADRPNSSIKPMANREALRELQTRLASRLQAARTSRRFRLVAGRRGRRSEVPVPAGACRRDLSAGQRRSRCPTPQPWFLGVANLRGGLYRRGATWRPFVAGARRLPVLNETTRAQSRLVALNEMLEVNCALLIDRLVGPAQRRRLRRLASRRPKGRPAWFGQSLHRRRRRSLAGNQPAGAVPATPVPEHRRLSGACTFTPEGPTMCSIVDKFKKLMFSKAATPMPVGGDSGATQSLDSIETVQTR